MAHTHTRANHRNMVTCCALGFANCVNHPVTSRSHPPPRLGSAPGKCACIRAVAVVSTTTAHGNVWRESRARRWGRENRGLQSRPALKGGGGVAIALLSSHIAAVVSAAMPAVVVVVAAAAAAAVVVASTNAAYAADPATAFKTCSAAAADRTSAVAKRDTREKLTVCAERPKPNAPVGAGAQQRRGVGERRRLSGSGQTNQRRRTRTDERMAAAGCWW